MPNRFEPHKIFVTVISHKRPQNVLKMGAIVGNVHWIVGKGEKQMYREAGAEFVTEGGGLCESRNLALKMAWERGAMSLQLSDDLKGLKLLQPDGKAFPIGFKEAMLRLANELETSGLKLAGASPTDNAYFSDYSRPVSTDKFIVGDLLLVKPCAYMFDERLKLKEDYDYTLQHLAGLGGALRYNLLLPSFVHRSNPGGAVEYRTAEREQEAIAYLKAKWPGQIVDNPRRPNEVLLRWKK